MERRAQNDLEEHKRDAYAHGAMVARVIQERITQKEDIEMRLRNLENWRWWSLGIGALLVFEIPIVVYILK